jgi:hypothetical protein
MKIIKIIFMSAILLLSVKSINAQRSVHFRICPAGNCLNFLPEEARINREKIPQIVPTPNENELKVYEQRKKTSIEMIMVEYMKLPHL